MNQFNTPSQHGNVKFKFRLLAAAVCSIAASSALADEVGLSDATILQIQSAMNSGKLTAEKLTQMYLSRIATFDDHGPRLNAVITVNPQALALARQLDEERRVKGARGPMHGIPVLLKDNINTSDMLTTGGSVTLAGSQPKADAFVVQQLRASGAIILGKTNLSEYATPAGRGAYSSINDFTKNPHLLNADPSGSSGGSGAATAATFASATLGSDTGGSVRGPAAANGVVGIRPSFGLISRSGVIPQSLSLDTVGPLVRSVTDAAVVISALAGVDATDPTTAASDKSRMADYTRFLDRNALRGKRIGVVRNFFGGNAEVDALSNAALEDMKRQGAQIVELRFDESFVKAVMGYRADLNAEFGPDLEEYLAALPEGLPKTLKEVVAIYDSPAVLDSKLPVNPALVKTHKRNIEIAGKNGSAYRKVVDEEMPKVKNTLLSLMDQHRIDAMVWPTSPCTAEPRFGIKDPGHVCDAKVPVPSNIASYSGFPDVQVPSGFTARGLPTSLSFVGRPFTEGPLIGYAYAYEQATRHRRSPALFPALAGETIAR